MDPIQSCLLLRKSNQIQINPMRKDRQGKMSIDDNASDPITKDRPTTTTATHVMFPFHSLVEAGDKCTVTAAATAGVDNGGKEEDEEALGPNDDDSPTNIIYPDDQLIANISLHEPNDKEEQQQPEEEQQQQQDDDDGVRDDPAEGRTSTVLMGDHHHNEGKGKDGSHDDVEGKDSSQRAVLGVIGSDTTTDDSDNINNNSTTTATSSSSSCCNEQQPSTTAADGGEILLESHGSQWKTLITSLLQRKTKKNKKMTMNHNGNKSKSMRRLLTFPPTLTFSETSSTSKKKSLRRKLTGIITNSSAVIDNDDDDNSAADVERKGHPSASLLVRWRPSWRSFDYHELVAATNNFCAEGVIGKGGYAQVYRGCLADGQLVAIKRLMKKDCSEEERTGDFLSELGVIAHVNHPNAACLLGFGVDGGLHLVLKFSPNGSLASRLHGSKEKKLTWESRYEIALGVAQGLCYLHEGCHRRIIHRDIKAANILLTDDYEPQISDFGLAKWLPDQWTHLEVFPIEGTFGYMAPEYFMHGIVSEKTDVFAFGVVLLELLTGRHAVDSNRQSLVMWAKPLLDGKELEVLVDPSLGDEYDTQQLNRLISVATLCIHQMPTARPIMKKVIELLKGEDQLSITTSNERTRRSQPTPPMAFDACETVDEDYMTCSTYLNDLNRHMQLALEQ